MKFVSKDCNVQNLCIKPGSLGSRFPNIGYGSEGRVYKYDEDTAIKMFDRKKYPFKLDKIKELINLKDPNFCFPTGVVYTRNNNLVGYKMDLVNNHNNYESFLELFLEYIPYGLISQEQLMMILFEIDSAIKRIHKYDYTIGDIRPKNILFDNEDKPVIIDTDSGSYKGYDYDLEYPRLLWAKKVYNKDFSKKDNDIYVWAVMFLESLLTYNSLNIKNDDYLAIELYQSKKMFDELIKRMNLDKYIKEGLREIFSDADNKPYIGDIFKDYVFDKPLINRIPSKILSLKYMR